MSQGRKSVTQKRKFGPVWFLPGPNQGRYPHCHSVFVEGAGVLIDPASDREYLKKLKDSNQVKMVWLTHWHEDHFTHLDLFEDLPLWLCEKDAPPLSDVEIFCDWYGLDRPGAQDIREYWIKLLAEQFHFKPRKPDRTLVDNEIINLGNVSVKVIHTPGHTPGHLSFYFIEPQVLFLGDYDLTKFGPWYGDVTSSIEDTIKSVEKLRQIRAKTWLTCHETGVFTSQPGQLWDQYLEVISFRETKLLDYLIKPRTMDQIVGQWIVYRKKREPKEFFEQGERAIMGKHLETLQAQNRVSCKNGCYKIIY